MGGKESEPKKVARGRTEGERVEERERGRGEKEKRTSVIYVVSPTT